MRKVLDATGNKKYPPESTPNCHGSGLIQHARATQSVYHVASDKTTRQRPVRAGVCQALEAEGHFVQPFAP